MEEQQIVIPNFTREDFLDTTAPFEFLHRFVNDSFTLKRMLVKVADIAKRLKVPGFMAMYKEYERSLKKAAGEGVWDANVTQFDGQELELSCGAWIADDMGISLETPVGERFACKHPILPVLRLVNIDTGIEKLQLSFRPSRTNKQWRRVIADKRTIASANSIVSLADNGIAVTSENAKFLVQYLSDVESENYDRIPEKASVSRLGWIDGAGFSPYVEGLVFDGEESFRSYFASVSCHGDGEKWLSLARELRKGCVPLRMILAASFASVLVKPVEALTFFVHLWGSESGTGKTVALMLAASVWATPEMGRYIHTFNGTAVSQELSAGFVNSLPFILDEFQVVKDKKTFEQSVYMLAEGVGKGRGAKQGGVQRLQTWRNCILTSGEMPITNFMTGAGAFNRIVEIECTEKLFESPQAALAVLRENYGFAGKAFVERLQNGGIAQAQEVYASCYSEVVKSEATEKQAMAGALLLTADRLATEWLFRDGQALGFEDVRSCLQTKTDVDIGARAYAYLCEVVSVNANRFQAKENPGEIWGLLDSDSGRVYINRSIFTRLCEEGGFSDRATLSWLMRNHLIETSVDKRRGKPQPTVQKKICGNNTKCVLLTLEGTSDEDFELLEELLE